MPLGAIQVPFPDSTMPGTPGHFQESGGRLINCYVEPLAPTAPSQIIYRRAPGLRNFGTTTRAGFRGAIEVNSVLYCAFGNRLVSLGAGGGAATDIGALTGTAKGFFARNMLRPTPNIVFCDPDGNYAKIDPSTGAIALNYDTDLPSPNSVCVLDNFFVYTISDGRAFASDFNSADVQPLSFGTAEAKADGLIRGVSWAGQLFLMGPSSTEVWANAGTTPFPFQRSVVIPRGIAGAYCVSGFEDNFSRALCWVADDNTVVRLNGYTPEKISPPDLDGLIERVSDKSQLEMSCFISRGHAFILLSSLTWSWVFDLNNNKWAERNSYLQGRRASPAACSVRPLAVRRSSLRQCAGNQQSGSHRSRPAVPLAHRERRRRELPGWCACRPLRCRVRDRRWHHYSIALATHKRRDSRFCIYHADRHGQSRLSDSGQCKPHIGRRCRHRVGRSRDDGRKWQLDGGCKGFRA